MAFLLPPCSSSTSHTISRLAFTPPITASSNLSSSTQNPTKYTNWVSNFRSKSLSLALSGALTLGLSFSGVGLAHALVGVNKPELLPKKFSPVIDVAGFLSDGQEKRLAQEIANIEKDTGYKLRVLAQNYPDTPGLAIKDFWQVDDRTIVFVADPTFGNILNFNVGALVDLDVPRSFWSRLAGKYGNMFYWKEKGEDGSIEAAVTAISSCLREPVGSDNCSEVSKFYMWFPGRRIRAGTSRGVSMIEVALSQLLYHLNWELGNGVKPDEIDMSETFGMGNMQETLLIVLLH